MHDFCSNRGSWCMSSIAIGAAASRCQPWQASIAIGASGAWNLLQWDQLVPAKLLQWEQLVLHFYRNRSSRCRASIEIWAADACHWMASTAIGAAHWAQLLQLVHVFYTQSLCAHYHLLNIVHKIANVEILKTSKILGKQWHVTSEAIFHHNFV